MFSFYTIANNNYQVSKRVFFFVSFIYFALERKLEIFVIEFLHDPGLDKPQSLLLGSRNVVSEATGSQSPVSCRSKHSPALSVYPQSTAHNALFIAVIRLLETLLKAKSEN